jgi:hypothetical protein
LDTRRGSAIARPDQSRKIVRVYFREPQATFEIHSNPPKAAKGQGKMKQKSESENDLKVGDRVRLKAQTLAWRAEMTLQGQIGEVVGRRDDGRVTIRFDGGKLLMGRDVNSFEGVREPDGMKANGK